MSFTLGVHYDALCLATASVAIQRARPEAPVVFLQLTPGVRGGKVSIGYGLDGIVGPCGPTYDALVDDMVLAVKASYLRTWWAPRRLGANQNYLGCEGEVGVLAIGSIGVFRALAPRRAGPDWVVSWSLGIGM